MTMYCGYTVDCTSGTTNSTRNMQYFSFFDPLIHRCQTRCVTLPSREVSWCFPICESGWAWLAGDASGLRAGGLTPLFNPFIRDGVRITEWS